jgi:hypothetical protein
MSADNAKPTFYTSVLARLGGPSSTAACADRLPGPSPPLLNSFDGSAWAGAPRLAIEELGYDLEKDFDVKVSSGATVSASRLPI